MLHRILIKEKVLFCSKTNKRQLKMQKVINNKIYQKQAIKLLQKNKLFLNKSKIKDLIHYPKII